MASDTVAQPPRDPIDLEAILAKLARDRAESDKLAAETRKLLAEDEKLRREHWASFDKLTTERQELLARQDKLAAEARKYRWDPLLIIAGAIIAGAFLRLPEILHVFGLG